MLTSLDGTWTESNVEIGILNPSVVGWPTMKTKLKKQKLNFVN